VDEMKKMADNMWREAKQIKENALKMVWFMRGGVQYEDILNMSREEIQAINKIIEENLETTKKSQMPFF
jgi:hypothetical protein